MKNLLNDFDIKKALNRISEEVIFALLQGAGLDTEVIKTTLDGEKGKRKRQEQLAEFIENQEGEAAPFCYRGLRLACFFHQHRDAFTGLHAYLAHASGATPGDGMPEDVSVADQVVLLYLNHPQAAHEYFIISLFTEQSKRFHQWRNDYSDSAPVLDAAARETLKAELWAEIKKRRGSKHCEMRSFEHDGKLFLLFDFEDLPAENREFQGGKPTDRYMRPSLEVAYAFDRENHAVEVVASDATTRGVMHEVCAKVLYGKTEIPKRPPDNDFYDLSLIYEKMADGQPIGVPVPEGCNVSGVFVETLRLRRKQFPFYTKELNIQCSQKMLESGRDYNMDMPGMAQYEIWKKGRWERSGVEADHATLVVMYYNEAEAQKENKQIKISRNGVGNLGHSVVDEDIKTYLRHAKILKTKLPPDQEEDEKSAA